MTQVFAVLRAHGPAWKHGQPLEAQEGWLAHACFMDEMAAEGFIVLGGPLGTDGALLIIKAKDEGAVRARLRAAPSSFALMISSAPSVPRGPPRTMNPSAAISSMKPV